MKVLLAEDSPTTRMLQRRLLEKVGFADIVEAEDGREALEAFRTEQFDLVLSDWRMPHVDGLELLKAVRLLDPVVPFVMVTTESQRAPMVEAIRSGVTDYVIKPLTLEVITQKVEKWVTSPVPVPCIESRTT